jgi:hypothetical protein
MKEKEGTVDCQKHQVVLYVEKENGKYGPIQTGSYISANYLDDFFFKRKNLEVSLRERVINGKISLVYYYMVLEDLSISELAARVGIRKSRIRKHLKPEGFAKCTVGILKRYASVFNIPISNLVQIVLVNIDAHSEPMSMSDTQTGKIAIEQKSTDNPYLSVTIIEESGQ